MLFQVPSTVNKITTLADSTIRLVVDCQETSPEEMAKLFALKGRFGWFLFKEDEVVFEDLPTEKAPEFKGDKTPSQRLRATLYVYWKECTNQKPDFNTFYDQWMNKKIEEIKQELP